MRILRIFATVIVGAPGVSPLFWRSSIRSDAPFWRSSDRTGATPWGFNTWGIRTGPRETAGILERRNGWTKRREGRDPEAPELIAAELERLRVLKEHELGARLEEAPEGSGPYVPEAEK